MMYNILCNEGNGNMVRGILDVPASVFPSHADQPAEQQRAIDRKENKKKRVGRACSFPAQISPVVPTFLGTSWGMRAPMGLITLFACCLLIYQSTLTHCRAICVCWDRLARTRPIHTGQLCIDQQYGEVMGMCNDMGMWVDLCYFIVETFFSIYGPTDINCFQKILHRKNYIFQWHVQIIEHST